MKKIKKKLSSMNYCQIFIRYFFAVSIFLTAGVASGQWKDSLPQHIRNSVLWYGDHEEGSLADYLDPGYRYKGGGVYFNHYDDNTTGGLEEEAVVDSAQSHSGRYSARATITNAYRTSDTRGVGLMRWTNRAWDGCGKYFPAEAYYSAWYYLPYKYNPNKYDPWDPGDGGWWNIFQFKSDDSDDISQSTWMLNVAHDDTNNYMYFYLYSKYNPPNSFNQLLSPRIPIPVGRWFHIEAFVRKSDTNGQIKIWQDGVLIFNIDNILTAFMVDQDPVSLRYQLIWETGNNTNHITGYPGEDGKATLYIDDAIVSTERVFQQDETMITGDIDGSGKDDIIVDFGLDTGTYVRLNNSTLSQLHALSPETMTIGDIDGGGSADVILDFGSLGVWVRMNNSTWVQLHTLSPEIMKTGDIDGSGKDDIIVDFGSLGTWIRMNDSTWTQLHTLSPEAMITGDIEGSGCDDVILDFGSLGTWIRRNNSSWVQLHTLSPETMAIGDMDGSGKDDIIVDFGSLGTWVRMNDSSWVQLHTLSPETMTTGDIDGGGSADVILDFGSLGIWVYMNNTSWAQLHTLSAVTMTTGDVDGGGQDDVIIDFGVSSGIWIRMNNSTWSALPTP